MAEEQADSAQRETCTRIATVTHKVGDAEWNAARAALSAFVAIHAPGAQAKLDRMTNAVVAAVRATRSLNPSADGDSNG